MMDRFVKATKRKVRNRTWRCQVEGLEQRDMLAANPLAGAAAMLGGVGGVGLAGQGGVEAANGGPVEIAPEQCGERMRDGGQCDGTVVLGDLTDAETESIVHMSNEEKLAHDVYLTLGELWSSEVFQQIASSEAQHMNAIASMCERYALDNPVADLGRGEYSVPVFASLYADLVSTGSTSLVAAFGVGAKIEELDIFDLQESLQIVEQSDIRQVYENLMRGSRNHLRAFANQIEQLGGEYAPEYLEQEAYDAIVDSPYESGRVDRIPPGKGNENPNGNTSGNNQQGSDDLVGRHARIRDRIVRQEESVTTVKQRSALREAAKDRVFAQMGVADRAGRVA